MRYALVVLIGSLAVQLLVPIWWLYVPLTALAGFFLAPSGKAGFGWGFLVNLLVWLVWMSIVNMGNDGILANRFAPVLGLPSGWLLVVVSALLAGVLGGLAGWGGALLRARKPVTA